jgi:hypothetical protein
MRSMLTLVVMLGLVRGAAAEPAPVPALALPDDARLGSARAELDGLVTRLADQGLPAELVVAKVREGLAKRVPVARILIVARKLSLDLVEVDALAQSGLRLGADRAPPGLLAALVDARTAGIGAKELAALLSEAAKDGGAGADKARGNPAAVATRAATALADLSARGYPSPGTGAIVGALARGDGRKLGRLVGALETLRRTEGLTPAQAFAAVRGALAKGADPDSAVKQATAAGTRGKGTAASPAAGPGKGKGKGPHK